MIVIHKKYIIRAFLIAVLSFASLTAIAVIIAAKHISSEYNIIQTDIEFDISADLNVSHTPLFNALVNIQRPNIELKKWIEIRAHVNGIDPKIIRAIAKIESNNNIYAIGITSVEAEKIAKQIPSNVKTTLSSNKKYLSLHPKNKLSAEKLFEFINLNLNSYDIKAVDYGLMQINHNTIKSYGFGYVGRKQIYLNPYYNVTLGIDILKKCSDKFDNILYMIECYNKGINSNKLHKGDYYSKFLKAYQKI